MECSQVAGLTLPRPEEVEEVEEVVTWCGLVLAGAGRQGGGGTAGKEAPTAAAASGDNVDAFKKGQLQQIVAMGFPKATARKALEKHGYDVEAAVHWIVVNTC